jgi:hypothetical protein
MLTEKGFEVWLVGEKKKCSDNPLFVGRRGRVDWVVEAVVWGGPGREGREGWRGELGEGERAGEREQKHEWGESVY